MEKGITELAGRAEEVLNNGLGIIEDFVGKNYLAHLSDCQVMRADYNISEMDCIGLYKVTKIVYDVNENVNDKLISVFGALSNLGSTVFMMIKGDAGGVSIYIGTKDKRRPEDAAKLLIHGLKGNFPGIRFSEPLDSKAVLSCIPTEYDKKAVSSVSIVPCIRDPKREKEFVQGFEKFIETMEGKEYTALIIATPVSDAELSQKKSGYEDLYTALSQYSQMVITYGENEGRQITDTQSESFTHTVNSGVSRMTNTFESTGTADTRMRNQGGSIGILGIGRNSGTGIARGKMTNQGSGTSVGENTGEASADGRGTAHAEAETNAASVSMQVTRQNKPVKDAMDRIEQQLERIKMCEAYGMWSASAYFISDSIETARMGASTFKGIMSGEKTFVENSYINVWDDKSLNRDRTVEVLRYLHNVSHPKFIYNVGNVGYSSQIVTPASMISGVEMPLMLGFPRKSVAGFTSIASAEFGRNIIKESNTVGSRIGMGCIYHMGEKRSNERAYLDVESLSGHCFVTGTTGSGKSNVVYSLITGLHNSPNRVKFLVIEPAKGEYKRVFGNMNGVKIYTTNPQLESLLRINPFEFDPRIHVLEHLDRLVEIFSACWPLYAAMPALLKSAFEYAYVRHGWDLNMSAHYDRHNGMFPTFADVAEVLPILIKRSSYSADTKGDYIGSLVTRVSSLSNGILGQVFSQYAIPDETLFDENTIIDLSRVGSAETKAVIMGTLILKLSEYRQVNAQGMNVPLRHVTVLEEAHNLLKRTSLEQGQELANLQGKSVEMISNMMAEMRTYGEGFIIVDQSPTSVDISAIKNTGTKIIMRLPENNDRQDIGLAVGLNEDQIKEMSRLERGVAVVYQSDWTEPVLVKAEKYESPHGVRQPIISNLESLRVLRGNLMTELMRQRSNGGTVDREALYRIVSASFVPDHVKTEYGKMLEAYFLECPVRHEQLRFVKLVYDLLKCRDMFGMFEDMLPKLLKSTDEIDEDYINKSREWWKGISSALDLYAVITSEEVRLKVMDSLILSKCVKTGGMNVYNLLIQAIYSKPGK